MKNRPAKKDQKYKLQSNFSMFKKTKEQLKKLEPQKEDNSVDTESTLSKFAKQNFGIELASDVSDKNMPSEKGSFSKRGNTKPIFECNATDFAPMNIFENQVIPVGIHNISKSFRLNLAKIRVFSLGTKFISKWDKTKTSETFKRFNEFKNKMNTKVYFYESKPGVIERNKNFRLPNHFVPPPEYMAVNIFLLER